MIEEELRNQINDRHRQRHDKIDFHLQVFDLAAESVTFSNISQKVHKNISTVKSAYAAAAKKIFGSAGKIDKKLLPLIHFNIENHFRNCATCRTAENAEQMCPEARLYCNLDHVSQHEQTGYDTTR